MNAISIGRLALLATAISAGNPATAEPDALFVEATRQLGDASRAYAYTVATEGGDEALVEAFDPSLDKPEQWQLKLVNGEQPTAARIERYREEKAKQLERNRGRSFAELIDTATVERRDERAGEVTYVFQPSLFDDEPGLNKAFEGTLVISSTDRRVLRMEYHNTQPVKPATAVNLEKMETLVRFETLANGVPVVKALSMRTRGVAFLFKKFDREITQEYSDYRAAMPTALP